jgi:two-component system, OmpR family, KDP operon response regulator KdpE
MTATMSGTILLVEDDPHIRKFLRISLEAHGFTLLEARQAADGLSLCAEQKVDLVILDLGLPDMDGQQFIRRLREWSSTPLLVLSVRSDEAEKVTALDSGANDYVTKPFGISELMARIRVLLRNADDSRDESGAVYEHGGLRVDLATRTVSVKGKLIHLSRKEYSLLRMLVGHPDRVLTHQQIIREIWGANREDETHHLRVLIGHLRQKLGDQPTRPRYILTVQGVGYRLLSGNV